MFFISQDVLLFFMSVLHHLLPLITFSIVFCVIQLKQQNQIIVSQQLAIGDHVCTTSGIIGVVSTIDNSVIIVTCSNGIKKSIHASLLKKII